jgi:hypothetical protein
LIRSGNALERFECLGASPIGGELVPMLEAPVLDESRRISREVALEDFTRGNIHEGLVPLVLDVDVRRRVIVVVHADVD